MKKYAIEILLLLVFIAVCYLGYLYKGGKSIQPTQIYPRESEIDSIKGDNIVIDSSIYIHNTNIKNIHNHYENEKNNIDSIPHDSLLSYIRANLALFNSRGEFKGGENLN